MADYLNQQRFKNIMGLNNPEPVTGAISTGLNYIKQPLDYYAVNKNIPAVGGMSAADFLGLTGTQGLLQDFSEGKNITGDMRMFDAMGLLPAVAPAVKVASKASKALGIEALRQMNEGSGLLGRLTIDPKQYITTWHGSPSVFNKFDKKFAKTGAGAEVYGPGTYLSEGMDLAKGYQPRSDAFENAVGKLSERAYNTDNYIAADIYDNFLLHKTPDEIKSTINEMYQGKDLIEANKALNQAAKLYQTKSKGGLYKVDLPDEYLPSLLNWDDPISTQSKEIQNLAKQYKLKPSDKGEALIGAVGGVEAAAKKLPEFGLQGVKYFDTYSPGSGAGTSNYVIYNPEILKILERNGLLLP